MLEIIINDIARVIPIPTQDITAIDAIYLLATEDGEYIITQDGEYINMKTTWVKQ